jgi:hypothetical protein
VSGFLFVCSMLSQAVSTAHKHPVTHSFTTDLGHQDRGGSARVSHARFGLLPRNVPDAGGGRRKVQFLLAQARVRSSMKKNLPSCLLHINPRCTLQVCGHRSAG